ncbi:MAG TPA: radical SAM protein [Candidatus Udaeobacter sp.]|nr:radical SAM protein [Candidatus Udaeobacter sp.]
MTLAQEAAEVRAALAAAWERVPELFRGPTQFMGRQYAGCGATIGLMPKCDFACTGCYLNADANRARPAPLSEVKEQLRQIRAWLGPCGNVQLTDGEVSLREESQLVEIIAYARTLGLVPMLMSHGETFRRRSGLLERLMQRGGLTEVCIHVDTTQRGRRDGYRTAQTEADLDGLRAEFARLIRTARARTGLRLEAASTVTVTQHNLKDVPGIVRWFLANADAFKMVSLQPLADVGRTDRLLKGVAADELWLRIAEGTGDPTIQRGEGWLGHPACSRFVQGLAVPRRNATTFVPLYRRDQADEMQTLDELLERLGGVSFRLDNQARAWRRAGGIAFRHGGFAVRRLLPYFVRLLRRTGSLNANYFCIVSHHFMSAAEMETAQGEERLAACAFRVPINGRLESMCAVNALGLREAYYRQVAENLPTVA